MGNIFHKAMEFIGLSEEEDALDITTEEIKTKRENDSVSFNPKKNKVVNIHTTTQLKVVVHSPLYFENAREIADHLKAKKPIVINLESVDIPTAKRIIDFISGSVYALDGNIQKIADRIFLIAPYNVGIMSGDIKDELKQKIAFPFSGTN